LVINNNIKTQEEVTKGIHTKESDITNTKQDNIISTTKTESSNQREWTIVQHKTLPKEDVKHRSLETTCKGIDEKKKESYTNRYAPLADENKIVKNNSDIKKRR